MHLDITSINNYLTLMPSNPTAQSPLLGLGHAPVLKTSLNCWALDSPARLCSATLASSCSCFPDSAGFGRRAASSLAPHRACDSEQWICICPGFPHDLQLPWIVLLPLCQPAAGLFSSLFFLFIITHSLHTLLHTLSEVFTR